MEDSPVDRQRQHRAAVLSKLHSLLQISFGQTPTLTCTVYTIVAILKIQLHLSGLIRLADLSHFQLRTSNSIRPCSTLKLKSAIGGFCNDLKKILTSLRSNTKSPGAFRLLCSCTQRRTDYALATHNVRKKIPPPCLGSTYVSGNGQGFGGQHSSANFVSSPEN